MNMKQQQVLNFSDLLNFLTRRNEKIASEEVQALNPKRFELPFQDARFGWGPV